jgi:CBS domain-containing protein
MKIRDILATKGSHVHGIGVDDTVLDAVARLVELRIGALLVRDARGAVAGIISERDVLRECQHHGAELGQRRVGAVMTRDLVVCGGDDDIDHAMSVMTARRIRHLPVMDGDRVAGMISIGDLVKATIEQTNGENRFLKEYIAAR